MRMVFEIDTDRDNFEKKLAELQGLEGMIRQEMHQAAWHAGDKWLKSLPEKYF